MYNLIAPVRHGLLLAVTALILGIMWAGYLATHHEQLHSGFEKQETALKAGEMIRHAHGQDKALHANSEHADDAPAEASHQHSRNLAMDAMQRLMRGHIHWMGLGILSAVMLLIVTLTSLKTGWKKTLGWTFGIGTLAYPVAWIVMGFRTVVMGPEAAEASVMWLFGPAAGLLLASLIAVFVILLLEITGWYTNTVFSRFFEIMQPSGEIK